MHLCSDVVHISKSALSSMFFPVISPVHCMSQTFLSQEIWGPKPRGKQPYIPDEQLNRPKTVLFIAERIPGWEIKGTILAAMCTNPAALPITSSSSQHKRNGAPCPSRQGPKSQQVAKYTNHFIDLSMLRHIYIKQATQNANTSCQREIPRRTPIPPSTASIRPLSHARVIACTAQPLQSPSLHTA
ncbi:hypothetical protein BJX66DRAFT_65408 [Aspergillus keveii]|uniref:Uncharacterized protein n=1 Tax=Aspergillus keveii TaxID=714993 RepID=A0ABR4GGK3_9EURO